MMSKLTNENSINTKVIIDYEEPAKARRECLSITTPKTFDSYIASILKTGFGPHIVQFVDADTGETVKGPKYDITPFDVNPNNNIKHHLMPGINQILPVEPTQYEPRDRFQEGKQMKTTREKFQELVRECLSEFKKESDPKYQLKESLRPLIKKVLNEISSGTKPELKDDDKKKINKGYAKDGNERIDKTNIKLQKELESIINNINPEWLVYWDDYNELNVNAKNLLHVRITPKFENNFDIDAMIKLVDRIRVISVTWDQVKDFIKSNFSDLENKTISDKMKIRSLDHYKDNEVIKKDAGPASQKINPRYISTDNSSIKDTKKDNKNYNEPDVKRVEDMPDQPMKQVVNPGKDPESKNKNIEKTSQVKPPKHKRTENDDKLKTNLSPTKKFRARTL